MVSSSKPKKRTSADLFAFDGERPAPDADYSEHIATLIMGDRPFFWLTLSVDLVVQSVRECIASEESRLRPVMLRNRVAEFISALKVVITGLTERDMIAAMAAADEARAESFREVASQVEHGAQQMGFHAERALRRVARGRGRVKKKPASDGHSSRELAALFVAELWRECRGREIPITNDAGRRACALLMATAEGQPGHIAENLDGWTALIRTARKTTGDTLGYTAGQLLEEGYHQLYLMRECIKACKFRTDG